MSLITSLRNTKSEIFEEVLALRKLLSSTKAVSKSLEAKLYNAIANITNLKTSLFEKNALENELKITIEELDTIKKANYAANEVIQTTNKNLLLYKKLYNESLQMYAKKVDELSRCKQINFITVRKYKLVIRIIVIGILATILAAVIILNIH